MYTVCVNASKSADSAFQAAGPELKYLFRVVTKTFPVQWCRNIARTTCMQHTNILINRALRHWCFFISCISSLSSLTLPKLLIKMTVMVKMLYDRSPLSRADVKF